MQDQDNTRPSDILPAGAKAPDFTLPSSEGGMVSLNQFRGRPVVLVFYPGDWTPVCTDQLSLYNQILSEFRKYNAQILAISVDSVDSHRAWAKARNLHFPLLADFEPKGTVSKKYVAYNESEGRSKRALFVVDPQGVIAWSYLSPEAVNPGADGILNALDALHKKERA